MHQQDLLMRSKSYDSRFNELSDIDNATGSMKNPINEDNEKLINSVNTQTKANGDKNDDSEQTKIIVTSFAPIPASADVKSRAIDAWKKFNNSSPTSNSYDTYKYIKAILYYLIKLSFYKLNKTLFF
jgi:hypothetical protein